MDALVVSFFTCWLLALWGQTEYNHLFSWAKKDDYIHRIKIYNVAWLYPFFYIKSTYKY